MARCNRQVLIAAWLIGLSASPAFAQTIQTTAAPQPAFLSPVDEPAAVNSPSIFTTEGIAPGTPAWGAIKADLDFLFLQPILPGRAVQMEVPSPQGGSVLGATGNLSNDFAFSPGIELGYQFKNTGFGVQVMGRMLHLTGKLERTIHDAGGGALAEATANTTVDVAVVNPIEGFLTFPLPEWCACEHPYLRDSLFTVTIGGRYATLQQNYSATVITGPGHQGSLVAKQSFDGLGLTSSLGGVYPLGENTAAYSQVRGSVLIGDNDRETTVTIVSPNLNTGTKTRELITDLFPMIEMELGMMYGIPINRPGATPNLSPLLWVKGGFVGQYWGNLGLLDITGSGGSQFSGTNLYLVGFTVQVGLDY